MDPRVPDLDRLRDAADVLRCGGIVAYPTDTLYGLAADPRNERAVRELYRIKGRLVDRAVPLIAADRAQVEELAGPMAPLSSRLAGAFWPGPLTLIVPAWAGLVPELLGGGTSVAIRVPDHAVARGLARALGYPVTSTSANRSGEPPTADPKEVARTLTREIAILLDGGTAPGGAPSTIVDATAGQLAVVREGAVLVPALIEAVRGPECPDGVRRPAGHGTR